MKTLHKNIKFLSLLLAIVLLFGCGTGETAKDPAGTITLQSPSFPEIQGMVSKVIAYLEIAGLNCPLTVDSDTTLNGQCPNIPNGTYSYTLKYVYTDTGVTLATTGGTATMESGQNHELSFPSLSKDYDDDSDGYTNLEEVKAGTNPKSSSSKPATPLNFDIWEATGAMNQARSWSSSILLSDGKVLVVGGAINPGQYGEADYYSSAELYDPTLGTFSYTSNSMNNRRGWHFSGETHGATLLSNGNVLIAGGYDDTNGSTQVGGVVPYNSAELYNPSTGTFSYTGNMPSASGHHSAILLQNGKVLIAGFVTAIYDSSNGTFSPTGAMIYPRMFQTATLLPNGKVLITGGHNGSSSSLNTAELFDPATGIFSQTGSMNSLRWQHTATLLPDGRVLIAGGTSASETQQAVDASILNSVEIYNPSTGTFSLAGTMNYPRQSHTATLLLNGKVCRRWKFQLPHREGKPVRRTVQYVHSIPVPRQKRRE